MPGSAKFFCVDPVDPSKFDIGIPHQKWQQALAESFAVLSCASPGEVVNITGPSRAGKSALIFQLRKLMFGEDAFENTGLMPAVVIEAVNEGKHATFSTKSFTQRLLMSVKHPLFYLSGDVLNDLAVIQKMERCTEGTLRRTLEDGLKLRRTRYLFIDEAQHVKYASKDAQAAYAVMDSWKCLAQTSGVVLVLVGAYPVLSIMGNSPHLLGRNHQVHFPRYYLNRDDVIGFGQILQKYSELIQLHSSLSSLTDVAELMYEGSLGCIGLLKAWIKRVDAFASIMNVPIDERLLREQRLTDHNLRQIWAEIKEGERLLKRTFSSMPAKHSGGSGASAAQPKKTKNKPFQKKPVRSTAGNRTEPPSNG
jgi:hypothetical protein